MDWPGLCLGPADDLDVASQNRRGVQQPFGGEPAELVVLELSAVGLRNPKERRSAQTVSDRAVKRLEAATPGIRLSQARSR